MRIILPHSKKITMHALTFINTFVAQTTKHNPTITRARAMKIGWDIYKNRQRTGAEYIKFSKVDKTVTSRIVSRKTSAFVTFTGTGKPLKEGQILLTDIAKYFAGALNPVISLYESNIIFQA